MGKYSDDTRWDDIVPLPQDDGGPNPLAAIAYTDEYSEAMSYLRAIMAKNEMSERALSLTEDIIDMNAAHYTVWFVTESTFSHRPPQLTSFVSCTGSTAPKSSKPSTRTSRKN